jgi:cholesterol oxidase
MEKFDVVIIGSGFGGAVTACRLAMAGAKVLVLERGRRWGLTTYPRAATDPWVYEHTEPQKHNGWLDLRIYKGMTIIQGAGVGGGSLCYSSVILKAKPELFAEGWPQEITYHELLPYYNKVEEMLGVQPIPNSQHTRRYQFLQEAAQKAGYGDRFFSVPLALSFDPEWNYNLPDPISPKHSKKFINPQGQEQGTCVHLGNCDVGCDVKAKNTLDFNYIPLAEKHGAQVRPLHMVRYLQPDETGYRVVFDRIENGQLIPGEVFGDKVILAAGSLGSTEILLRCRDQFKTLPLVSQVLGKDWSANGNVLTPDFYDQNFDVRQSIGPTISSALDFSDRSHDGQSFIIEDDGFPNMLLNALRARLRSGRVSLLALFLGNHLQRGLQEKNPLRNVMIWLGAGVDAADGQLVLGGQWFKPWRKDIQLKWNISKSKAVIDAILQVQQRISQANGGKLYIPMYWSVLKSMVTVHPLGGCKMGNNAQEGVVNHLGEVFNYSNLYVADGAIIPVAIGRNPSMTIAALAERIASKIIEQDFNNPPDKLE